MEMFGYKLNPNTWYFIGIVSENGYIDFLEIQSLGEE